LTEVDRTVGADDDQEKLSLVQKSKCGKWIVDASIDVTQIKDDVVKFVLHTPLHRYTTRIKTVTMMTL